MHEMNLVRCLLGLIASVIAALLVVPLLLVGLPFWGTAVITRALARWRQPRTMHWSDIFRFDSLLGWRAKPNLDGYCLEERDDVFHVRTDSQGWPGQQTLAESKMVVIGDSHAFGYGVDAAQSFAAAVRRVRVKSLGVPGYNMVQELLLMRELGSALAGKVVVWLVYVGNDLYDNLSPAMNGYRTPFVRERAGRWEIVTGHVSPDKWTVSAGPRRQGTRSIHAALHAPTPLARRAYDACAFLIAEAASLCRQVGARLVVAALPAVPALAERGVEALRSAAVAPTEVLPDYPERRLGEICRDLGVRFVPLREEIGRKHFKRNDDHLTVEGHRRLAEVLERIYTEGRALPEGVTVR